jgi:hypothetical protein
MRVGAHTPTHARTPTTFTQTATRTPKTPATAPLITKCAKELIVINGRLHIFDKHIELAISKSIKQSWPTCKVGVCINYFLYKAQVTHCWVHFRRSGRRWLGANGMLSLLDDKTTLYSTGTHGGNTFSTWVLCVYALAYVPADCVVNVFESVEWPQVLADFITDYFEGEIELFNC